MFAAMGPVTLGHFRDQCRHPLQTQSRLLAHLLKTNAQSAYGKAHGFADVTDFESFQKSIPVTTYDDLLPYIESALNGQPRQLTVETPVLFATTSGTTGTPKYIPVTPASKSAKSQLMRIWLSALHRDHPVFAGRVLTVVSPEAESFAPCGTPCGAESGHGYKNIPRAIKSLYTCPYEVYEIKNYDAKYYTMLRIAAGEDLSLIYTCNPSTVLLMAQRLGQATQSIIQDVHDGTIAADVAIPDQQRSAVGAGLRPDPDRARFLERAAAAAGGALTPRYVWPKLATIACWKGGTVGMYVDQFDEYFTPGLPVRDIGYFASEHRGSVPISDDDSAGVLAIPTNVYEFFPADSDAKPKGHELLSVDQLEQGNRYFIYVTTAGGLYRYDMNDIIEVTGFYEKTPLIRFVQKGKGVVSFTGEKLYETQVITAVQEGVGATPGRYEFITALGQMSGSTPQYIFLIEFDRPPGSPEDRCLLESIEQALRVHNVEYASKRDSQRLGSPVLRIIKRGEFDRYRRRAVQGGKSDGQFKTLRLTTDASFAAEFETEREVVVE